MALTAVSALGLAACSSDATGNTTAPGTPPRTAPSGPPLVLAVEGEPRTLVPAVGGIAGNAAEHLFELVHQSLVSYDDRGQPIPRLARALPSLERGTWKVFADGTMETTWELRDDARWHDGRPFTAADVIFSWRAFNDPSLPVASRRVARLITAIASPNPLTVVMQWRNRYAFADQISWIDLTILPSHLLEASFELRRANLSSHPYWRSDFVGLGPYRLKRWPSGASLELEATPDYFLGHPRINDISVRFIPDDSSAMASVLSSNVDALLPRRAAPGIVRTVRQRWADGAEGTLSVLPGYSWLYLAPQFLGPSPDELSDVRLRQALVHALDRPAIAEVLTGDRTLAADLWVPKGDPRYDVIANEIPQYGFDLNRARELFREAGWRREGPDDTLVKQGRRFEIELTTTAGWERVAALVAEYWRGVGVTVREDVRALGAIVDRQARAAYPGIELAGGAPGLSLIDGRLHSANIPGADNQFVGGNRGHYVNASLDQLIDRVWVSLDPGQRPIAERAVANHIATELPFIGLFFYPAMMMGRRTLQNVRPPSTVTPVGRILASWNAHEWEKPTSS